MYIAKIIFMFFLSLLIFMTSGCGEDDETPCANPCPNCPIVESIFPTTAAVGDTIVITGQNFDRFGEGSDDKITIGGVEAIFTGTKSDTQITVEIPEDFVEGDVVVCSVNPGNTNLNNILCSDDLCIIAEYPSPVLKEEIITFEEELSLAIPNVMGVDVVQREDDGYVVLCNELEHGAGFSVGVVLAFIDKNGQLTTKTELDLNSLGYEYIEAIKILEKKDGGLAILGQCIGESNDGVGPRIFLVITDEDGQIMKKTKFTSFASYENSSAILQAENDRLIILGYAPNGSFLKLATPAGAPITSAPIQTLNGLDFYAENFYPCSNSGEFVFVGQGINQNVGFSSRNMILLAKNNGSQIESQEFFGDNNALSVLTSVSKTEQGFISIGLDNFQGVNPQITLHTYNSDLENRLQRLILPVAGSYPLPTLLKYDTDEFALLFSANDGAGEEISLIFYNSSTNEVIDNKRLVGSGRTQAESIIQTRDGGFCIVGHTYVSAQRKLYLAKTDSQGNL